ncbi:MAG: TraR/DksA family transcriptional regulator [Gemmatimonadaceae bacterium]
MTNTQAFTPSQLRELKSEMEDELAWLLRSLTAKSPVSEASSHGKPSTVKWSEVHQVDSELRNRAQRRLGALLASLQKLDNGSYGECENCGRRIPYSKLAVMPEAVYCTTCSARRGAAVPPQPVA